HELFGADVAVVPREDAPALARAIIGALSSPRRVDPGTQLLIERDFRPEAIDLTYRAIYARALEHDTKA
ncbi:MAG: hypothetical protein IMZ55_05990, partial [Acidobacteria bacterium]|nr:hypothetical protein [Acidobacteriota bacterium]